MATAYSRLQRTFRRGIVFNGEEYRSVSLMDGFHSSPFLPRPHAESRLSEPAEKNVGEAWGVGVALISVVLNEV